MHHLRMLTMETNKLQKNSKQSLKRNKGASNCGKEFSEYFIHSYIPPFIVLSSLVAKGNTN